jgi:hypothetical protein
MGHKCDTELDNDKVIGLQWLTYSSLVKRFSAKSSTEKRSSDKKETKKREGQDKEWVKR